jgi:hypothetical protein
MTKLVNLIIKDYLERHLQIQSEKKAEESKEESDPAIASSQPLKEVKLEQLG